MEIQTFTPEAALRALFTTQDGLTTGEAAGRLEEYGPNEIKLVRRTPLYIRFASQFVHFLAILLWVAAGLCLVSEALHPGEGLLRLTAAIVAVIFINAVFTFVQEYRAEKAVEALRKLLPYQVKAVREGKNIELCAEEVVPGDIVVLAEGDRVPADARLVDASGMMVNHAPLTGESDALPRNCAPFDKEYTDSPNLVFAGTTVVKGSGRAAVYATGMSTEFGKIAGLTGTVESGPSPLQKEIVRVTRVVTVIAVSLGIFFFALGFVIGRGFWHNFLFAIGIIIANVPEGLLPTVTLSLAMGSQRMAKRKALIKNLASVETLGSVSVICTDKTGTLTTGKMAAGRVWTPDGYEGEGEPTPGAAALMDCARLCNNAVYEGKEYRGDPTEAAILKAAIDATGELKAERLREVAFDSERKRMTTVNAVEGKTRVFMKGAPEAVLSACTSVMAANGEQPLDDNLAASIKDEFTRMMEQGYRVMAFAFKELDVAEDPAGMDEAALESGLCLAGIMGLADPPRPEVADAVARCRGAGIRVVMVTGDAGATALAVARQIGLAGDGASAVEGPELAGMTDRELMKVLSQGEPVFARMTPRHKLRIVSLLMDEGERVAVTGDGVNDAPALKKADIGIAMGLTGTDVAREASDMVLMDDNFASIVSAVEEGRAVFENIRKFVGYIFASNIPEIVPYIAYVLFAIPLPLTIMQILAVDLGTDMFPALALGAERPSKGTMDIPPRGPDERLLNWKLIARSYFFLGPIEAAAGLFGFFYVLYGGGWSWGAELAPSAALYIQATSACLAAIVVTQIANVNACRSASEPLHSLGLFSNPLVLYGIGLELAIAWLIFYTSIGNGVFGTAPLAVRDWLVLIPFGVGLLLAEEGRKYLARRIGKPASPARAG
jgi:sodium/potassium-transporting ATPase subunit alpha